MHAVVGNEVRQPPIVAKPVLQGEQVGVRANRAEHAFKRGVGHEMSW